MEKPKLMDSGHDPKRVILMSATNNILRFKVRTEIESTLSAKKQPFELLWKQML